MDIPRGHNRVRLHMQDGGVPLNGWAAGNLTVVLLSQSPLNAQSVLPVRLAQVAAPVSTAGWQAIYEVDPAGPNQIAVGFGAGFSPTTMVVLATSWAEGL